MSAEHVKEAGQTGPSSQLLPDSCAGSSFREDEKYCCWHHQQKAVQYAQICAKSRTLSAC